MLAISQLLLTRFWWNFNCRFLGTSRTDSMVIFVQATFVQVTFVHIKNISAVYWPDFDQTFGTYFSWGLHFSGLSENPQPNINPTVGFYVFWSIRLFRPNFFWPKVSNICSRMFCPRFLALNFWTKHFLDQTFLDLTFFWTKTTTTTIF